MIRTVAATAAGSGFLRWRVSAGSASRLASQEAPGRHRDARKVETAVDDVIDDLEAARLPRLAAGGGDVEHAALAEGRDDVAIAHSQSVVPSGLKVTVKLFNDRPSTPSSRL